MREHISKKKSNQKKIGYSLLAIIVTATLLIRFSRAWFYKQNHMESLMEVKPPADISILGPGGSEMTSLELNSANAEKGDNGKLTIRRVICVQSDSDYHKIEIVHTTNLKGLEFKLFAATKSENGNVTDGGYSYQYDPNSPISGTYVNRGDMGTTEYKSADKKTKYSQNFSDTDKVQLHAEPLYWKAAEVQKASTDDNITIDEKVNHRTYYVCEVSWTETTKETDVFYVLAETAKSK